MKQNCIEEILRLRVRNCKAAAIAGVWSGCDKGPRGKELAQSQEVVWTPYLPAGSYLCQQEEM